MDREEERTVSALTEFLYPAPARRTVGSILAWWEKRRLAYNVAVGGAGLFSLGYVMALSTLFPGPSGLGPPILGVVAFGVLANLCYLLGPTVEIVIEKIWGRRVLPTGPSLYRIGLTFSVGLALFPALLATIAYVGYLVFGVLLGMG